MTDNNMSLENGALALVCPRDHRSLIIGGAHLTCEHGHTYHLADGIPVLLTDAESTHWGFRSRQLEEIEKDLTEDRETRERTDTIDPYVTKSLVWTSGNLYRRLLHNVSRYPIPEIRLPEDNGKLLLDVGCNWGRWSIAAARKGYRVVGIDPSLAAVLSARRVAKELGVEAQFIVGDARFLPFANNSLDCVFSYSVLQHFAPQDAWASLSEVGRTLKPDGMSLIQMANSFGVRSLYHQAKRGFGEAGFFGVHYYSPGKLRAEMQGRIGPTKITVDGFLGLGIQQADRDLMPTFEKMVISTSEALRHASGVFPPLRMIADSLYFESRLQ